MNLLLDTHVLLWWLADDPVLGARTRSLIGDPANRVAVSAASAWEISIKRALGKLTAPDDLGVAIRASELEPLAITIEHGTIAGSLPRHHDDPFDRMLIAQAMTDGFDVVTEDSRFAEYGVTVHRG